MTMTVFQWKTGSPPDGVLIRQVYGYCFDGVGRVLLLEEAGSYGLPGGKPETGESSRATLERECLEEAQVTLAACTYLGYQEVCEAGCEPYAQLRFAAQIEQFLPSGPDPDTGGRTGACSRRCTEPRACSTGG